MADKLPVVRESNNDKVITATWSVITETDEPVAVGLGKYRVKSVQITGNLGTATVTVEGSNDNLNFDGLTDDGDTAITGKGLFNVYENPAYLKPVVATPSAATAIVVVVAMSSLR